jgi:hypothetical protein
MASIGLIALAAAAQAASATLGVGATVVRPERAQVTISGERASVGATSGAVVTVEGGRARRTRSGMLAVTPAGTQPVRIVFTY